MAHQLDLLSSMRALDARVLSTQRCPRRVRLLWRPCAHRPPQLAHACIVAKAVTVWHHALVIRNVRWQRGAWSGPAPRSLPLPSTSSHTWDRRRLGALGKREMSGRLLTIGDE